MIRPFAAPFRRLLPVALAAALLGGCNAVQRISEIGAEPVPEGRVDVVLADEVHRHVGAHLEAARPE